MALSKVRTGVSAAATTGDARKQKLILTVVSALVVATALQGKAMAYNNYSIWRLEFMVLEWAICLAGSFGANLVAGMDERSEAWAASYVPARTGWLYDLLRKLLPAVVRGAIIAAFASVVNATAVPTLIYREDIGNPIIAVITRWLADVPTVILVCLLVRLVLDWRAAKAAAA